MVFNAGNAARVLQTVVLAAVSWGLAWLATGSTAAPDWLPYAFLTALVLAAALIGGTALRPRPRELAVVGALVALAGWEALSIVWSAVPDLARDEALLTIFYAIALLVPLRGTPERLLALAA